MNRPAAPPRQGSGRASLAWLLAGVGMAAVVLVIVSRIASHGSGATVDDAVGAVPLFGSVVAFLLSGAIIASRQPDNVIGWVLMTPGLSIPIAQLGLDWLARLDPPPTSVDPLMWVLIWFCSWAWITLIFPIFHLLLTFPDGRLLSPRWRPVVALESLMVGTFVVLAGLMVELTVVIDDQTLWSVPNPIGFVTNDDFASIVFIPWAIGLLTLTVLSASAVVLRFRRGTPEARRQLQWPVSAVAFFGVVYGVYGVGSTAGLIDGVLWEVLFALAIMFIPVSVAIAILRYRLYEIDRIVSRTIAYAVVTAVLFGVFFGVNIALQRVLGDVVGSAPVVVAGSTLVVAALFQPLRARVQRAVDRRFHRARYDAER
ncbi:MAG TPA: hypothetical protein VF119_02855, partial [Candidatus Limnocylindrales bacterium]